jgi:hypothetical protein
MGPRYHYSRFKTNSNIYCLIMSIWEIVLDYRDESFLGKKCVCGENLTRRKFCFNKNHKSDALSRKIETNRISKLKKLGI